MRGREGKEGGMESDVKLLLRVKMEKVRDVREKDEEKGGEVGAAVGSDIDTADTANSTQYHNAGNNATPAQNGPTCPTPTSHMHHIDL